MSEGVLSDIATKNIMQVLLALYACKFFMYESINEPEHDKTYIKTCATSKDSDQPVDPRSLIRVFTDRMCLLQRPGYPKGEDKNSCRTS